MNKRFRKKALYRSTLRDIKGSLGRFFAIFAIIALGVGFFSGVKITTPVMVNTIDTLYKDKNLFDYKLVSTLGWEDKDVERVRSRKDVEYAEGAFEYDVICLNNEDKDIVFKALSITDNVNGLMLREGRLPENANEVILDNKNRNNFKLGDTLRLSPGNSEDTFGHFKNREYTIVGFTDSVLYINFERGSTSLGNGIVDGFIYLPKDAFDEEVYTEIYVKLTNDSNLFSDEYDEKMDDKRPKWEETADEAALSRYDRIYSEASEEISDAKETLAEEKADAEKELSDAREELDDGKKELDDAAAEISDGEMELSDAANTLSKARKPFPSLTKKLGNEEQSSSSPMKFPAPARWPATLRWRRRRRNHFFCLF